MSITFTTTLGGPAINMANGNAAATLDALGFPVEPWGEIPAEDFLNRIDLVQELYGPNGPEQHGTPAITDGRWTTSGRRGAYMADRLEELWLLAYWARDHEADVTWG